MEERGPGVEALLAHADWVRALARRLVYDAARVDDVVQQAWLEAIERPPRHAQNLRAWFGDVLRNAARNQARSEARRSAREREAARDEARPSTAELVEEAATQRELVGLVLELDEAYRVVLLLRFFRDHPPRRIARELGIPVETVKTRQARGLAQLRERLEQEHGGREAWCRALIPLAAAARSGVGGAGLAAALVGALLVAGGLVAWRLLPAPPAPEGMSRSEAVDGDSEPVARAERPSVASAGEVGARAPGAADAVSARTPPPVVRLAGRVVDAEGRALAGVVVRQADPQALRWKDEQETVVVGVDVFLPIAPARRAALLADEAELDAFCQREFTLPAVGRALLSGERAVLPAGVSDGAGRFELEVERGLACFELDEPARVLFASAQGGARLVAVPARALRGRVTDASGAPVESARVELRAAPDELLAPPDGGHWDLPHRRWSTRTDAAGRFTIARAPELHCGLTLFAEHEGRRSRPIAPRVDAREELTLTLSDALARLRVHGTVLLPDGRPAPGAQVRLAGTRGRADGAGRYVLELSPPSDDAELSAASPGYAPARVAVELGGATGERELAPLVLGDRALAIAGRVVERDGTPLARAQVRLRDGTQFGPGIFLEDAAAGRTRGFVETDGEGRFELSGLEPRAYSLLLHEGADATVSEPIAAGARDVGLVLERRPRGVVRGRVVGLDGTPLEGVTLTPAPDEPAVDWDGRVARSDAEGAFELRGVPLEGATVMAWGRDTEATTVELTPALMTELRLARLVRVEVETNARGGDRVRALDADGSGLPFWPFASSGSGSSPSGAALDGRFPALLVSERAVTLELLRGTEMLDRRPVRPTPGEVLVVRW